ncbi:pentatricopeptide repeat-containing protein At3g42630 isoform X2 [Macadamia integrifolia]|uniref:pentatricopeptide repeat-containing protein At3g42630 isoform X2 n=1 Tax=Macadamia integrifolia TaxID=60698 RepID=UPI001C528E4B|nr:pentatricopeptide repeat-containing protein At3g42630 isoform X2 [Macadamia integrifolia]
MLSLKGELEELHGNDPIQVLRSLKQIIWHCKQKKIVFGNDHYVDFASFIRLLGRAEMPHIAQKIFVEMKSDRFQPCLATLSALMLCHAENGLFSYAKSVWEEIIASSFVPNIEVVSDLMNAYGKMGHFNEVTRILHEVTSRDFDLSPEVYSVAISCFGKGGQLEMMEATMKEMVQSGFNVDSATANAFVSYYAAFGSLTEMEVAYGRLKKSRILIEATTIRAVALAYIKERKFYRLGEFLKDVDLGRRDVGNLLWNNFLLSYAGRFKMKSLQREFLKMVDAGFSPDLNTFNIRSLAFSRMSLFWDLHVSLEHMKHEKVIPDLVTYGCVVDAYLDRKLGRNMNFALNKMNVDNAPIVSTDPLVFEVFGKGDFHSSSEAFMEYKKQRKWTYKELIAMYLKKEHRRNQIFWNY